MKKLSLKTAAHLKREIAVSSEAKSAGIMEIYSEHFQRRMARRSPFEAAVSLCERAQPRGRISSVPAFFFFPPFLPDKQEEKGKRGSALREKNKSLPARHILLAAEAPG